MAILVDIQLEDWMTAEQFKDELQPLLPDVSIYCRDPGGHWEDIRMLATVGLHAEFRVNPKVRRRGRLYC